MSVASSEAVASRARQCSRAMQQRDGRGSAMSLRTVQSAMDVEKSLVRAIGHRTGRRVRSLHVQFTGSRVVLRGWAVSYHAVQLALVGLFEGCEEMGLDRPEEIELDIDVLDGPVSTLRPR